jgi:hypothetical protein
MLYLIRAFADSVLSTNERIRDRLQKFIAEGSGLDNSRVQAEFENLLDEFRNEMNPQHLQIYTFLDSATRNPQYPEKGYLCQEISKAINIAENPFSTKRMVNQLANTLDLYPILHLAHPNQPLFTLYWEYEAEKWRADVNTLKSFEKITPIIMSGNTLRDDIGRAVPVYENEVSINLRDTEIEIYEKVFNASGKLGLSGNGNICKLLGWDLELAFETWTEVLQRTENHIIEELQFRNLLNPFHETYTDAVTKEIDRCFKELSDGLPWQEQNTHRMIDRDDCERADVELFYLQRKAFDIIMGLKRKYGIN